MSVGWSILDLTQACKYNIALEWYSMVMDLFDRYDNNATQYTTSNLILMIRPCLLGCRVKRVDS